MLSIYIFTKFIFIIINYLTITIKYTIIILTNYYLITTYKNTYTMYFIIQPLTIIKITIIPIICSFFYNHSVKIKFNEHSHSIIS